MDKCNLFHILAYTIDLQELRQLTADYISQNKQYFLGNWTIFPSKTKLTLHLGKITQIVWFSQVVWHMMSCSTLGSKKLGHKIFFLILPLNRTILRKCFLLFLYPHHHQSRDTKNINFPVGRISRTKTFWMECLNRKVDKCFLPNQM